MEEWTGIRESGGKQVVVGAKETGVKAAHFVREHFADIAPTQSIRRACFKDQKIIRNGIAIESECTRLIEGDVIELLRTKHECSRLQHIVPYDLIFSDSALLVIHKVAGITLKGKRTKSVEETLDQIYGPSIMSITNLERSACGLALFILPRLVFLPHEPHLRIDWAERLSVQFTYAVLIFGTLDPESLETKLKGDNCHISTITTCSVWKSRNHDSGSISWLRISCLRQKRHSIKDVLEDLGHPVLGVSSDAFCLQHGARPPKCSGAMLSLVELRLNHPLTNQELTFNCKEPPKFQNYLKKEGSFFDRNLISAKEALDLDFSLSEEHKAEILGKSHTLPLAYMTGKQTFCERDFIVTPHVLIPKESTETLIRVIHDCCFNPKSILDLGTGSGCLLLTLLCDFPDAKGVGIDISEDALAVAKLNQHLLLPKQSEDSKGESQRCLWAQGCFDQWPAIISESHFDLIVANPPYLSAVQGQDHFSGSLSHEPKIAVFSDDCFDAYRAIARGLDMFEPAENCNIVLEVGCGMADKLPQVMNDASPGFKLRWIYTGCFRDIRGVDRCCVFEYTKSMCK